MSIKEGGMLKSPYFVFTVPSGRQQLPKDKTLYSKVYSGHLPPL
jgi:hypothetical protein